ncbi:PREDICTED: uncharacterized protein LOC109472545 [Branchiostoma belcheri]|uniref:Phosphoinositide phospholipase C n=1 Tax=Branchiostoma belcheri TaxID=7741 RepID=A0A6P4YU71_BRABE|nr:PREDICTED: uncharacterized protein LOC109472545 [Branchiostoma belcheri]
MSVSPRRPWMPQNYAGQGGSVAGTRPGVLSCLVRLQEGSLLTKLKDGVRSLPKNFYLDEDKSCVRWKPSRKGDNAKIPITYITDVREGLRSGTDPPLNLDPSCCFHLIHGNEGEAIELVARSAEEAGLWVRGLRHLVMEMREESGFEHKPITNWHYQWLLECFSLVDGDRDGRLTWQEAMLLFDRLNIYDTSGKIQDMVQRAVEGPGLLDWEGFLGLYRTISTRQDLVVLLKKYSEGKDFLTAAELAQFLEKEQKVEDCSRGQCLDIIAHCEPREDYMLNGWLGLDGFTNYLMSHHGEIFDSSHHAVHQDMTQPLSHYYIATSHNTYLQGDQLLSESNVDMYAWVLQSGCRCVELDCWDGPEGDPIVYHGYTLTSRVYFRDVIDVINRYAFINNSYPVILCLENHCSLDQQRKMALYLTQILAGKLEVPPLPPGATHLPSPQDLRGKILIMSKKLTPGIPSDTRCGEVSDEDSADEMEEGYKLLPGELMESSCRKHIVESYARSKLATLAKSGKTVAAEKEHHKLPVSPRQRARLALANSPLIRRKRGGSSDHEDSDRQRQRDRSRSRERKAGRSSSFSEADAVDAQDRKFGAKVLSDTFNKLTHRKKKKQPVKPPGLPTLHSQEQLQDVNDIIPDNKEAVVMETHALATAAVGEKAQGQRDLLDVGRGRKGGEKHTRRMLLAKELSDLVWYMGTVSTVDFKSDVPCWQVPSISENKATALSADHAADMAAFTRSHLFRIYPSARRVDSSNYDPQALWNMGCQMVALNYQTEGRMMQLNRARFSANGGCGYTLKPAVMWEDNKSFNPLTTSPLAGVTRRQLTVRVLSGQQLRGVTTASEGPAELRVEVEVLGLGLDYHKEQTRPHSTDGYNPTWDDTMTFNLTLPDLAMVRFTVVCYYDHQQEVIGHRTVPFISLLTGYRHVHMEGHPASVFVHVSVTDYQGKGKYRTGIKNFITRNWSLRQGGSFRETSSAPIIKKPPAVNFTKRLGKLTMPKWHLGSGSDSASTASDEHEHKPAPDTRDANVSVVRGDGSVVSPAVWAAQGKGQGRPTHLTMVRGDGTIASPAIWATPGPGKIPEDQLRLRRRMSPAQTPGDNRCSFIVEDTSIAGFLTELWDQKAQEYKEYVITEETEHPEQGHLDGQSGTVFQQEPIQHVNGQSHTHANATQKAANATPTATTVDQDKVVAKKGVKFEKKRPEMGRAFYIQGTRPKQSSGRSRKDKAPLVHKESYQPPQDNSRTAYKHLQDSGTYMYSAPYRLRQAGTPPMSPAKRPDSSHLFRHASADRLHDEREYTGTERRRRVEGDEYTGTERRRRVEGEQRRAVNIGAVQGYREVAVDVPPEMEERNIHVDSQYSDSPYRRQLQSSTVNPAVQDPSAEDLREGVSRQRKRPPSRSRAERRSRQGPVPSEIVHTESKTSSELEAKTPPQDAAEDKKVKVHDTTEEESKSDDEGTERSKTPTKERSANSSPPIFNKDSPPFVNGLLTEEDLQYLQQAPEDLQRILATEDFTNRTDEYKLLLERAKKSVRLKEIRSRRESYLAAMATEYSPSGKDGGGLGGRSPRGQRRASRPRKAVVKPLQHEEETAPVSDVTEKTEGVSEAKADDKKPRQDKSKEKDDALKQKGDKGDDSVTAETGQVKDEKKMTEDKDKSKDVTTISDLDVEAETKETSAEQKEKQSKKGKTKDIKEKDKEDTTESSDSSSDSPSSPVKTNATFGDSIWDEISDLSEVSESVSSSTSSLDTVIDTTNDSIDQELQSLEEEERRAAEIIGEAKPEKRPDPETTIQQASAKELQPPKDEVEMKKLKEKICKSPTGFAGDGGLESVEVLSDTSSETSIESQNEVTLVEREKISPEDVVTSSTANNEQDTEEDASDRFYAEANKESVATDTKPFQTKPAPASDETECFDTNGKSKSLGDITSEDIHCNKFDSKYKTISKSFITKKMREQKRFSPLRGPVMPKKPLEQELIKLTTFTPEERALPQPTSRLEPKTSTPKKLTFSSRSESRVKHIASRKRTQSESGSQDTEASSFRRTGDAVFVLTAKAEAVPRRNRPPTPPIYQYRHSTGSYIPGYIEGPAPLLEDRGVPEGACSTPGTAPDIVPMASPQGDSKLEEEPEIYFLLNV